MKRRPIWTAIRNRHANYNIIRIDLGILDKDVEIAILVENSRVNQFIFQSISSTHPVHIHQLGIRKFGLRILVKALQVRVCGCGVQVVIHLLDVFAMIALMRSEPEQTLFQDRIARVPEGHREAQPLVVIADPRNPILAPPVGPQMGMLKRKILPSRAIRAVIFSNRTPSALG